MHLSLLGNHIRMAMLCQGLVVVPDSFTPLALLEVHVTHSCVCPVCDDEEEEEEKEE